MEHFRTGVRILDLGTLKNLGTHSSPTSRLRVWQFAADGSNVRHGRPPRTVVIMADSAGHTGPEMFHYVRKDKIAESAVMGTFVIALCGERFPVTKTPKPGSPVCPRCKEIYETMTG